MTTAPAPLALTPPAPSSEAGEAGRPGALRRLGSAVSTTLLLACVALAVVMLIPGLLGYHRYVITSGSMTGSYDRGSIVYEEEVPTTSLKVGDVITYKPPPNAGPSGLVTHRIAWAGRDAKGRLGYRTKGDANPSVDPWSFTLDEPTQARAVFGVPYIGFAFAALAERETRMLIIGIPAALVALGVLLSLWREAGEETRKTAEGRPEGDDAPEGSTA